MKVLDLKEHSQMEPFFLELEEVIFQVVPPVWVEVGMIVLMEHLV